MNRIQNCPICGTSVLFTKYIHEDNKYCCKKCYDEGVLPKRVIAKEDLKTEESSIKDISNEEPKIAKTAPIKPSKSASKNTKKKKTVETKSE